MSSCDCGSRSYGKVKLVCESGIVVFCGVMALECRLGKQPGARDHLGTVLFEVCNLILMRPPVDRGRARLWLQRLPAK